MRVFVLIHNIDYEGGRLIDVYEDYAKAISAAHEYNINGFIGRYVVVEKELIL